MCINLQARYDLICVKSAVKIQPTRYQCLTSFFPMVDTCLSCKDTARQNCAMVPKWRLFASCICSEPQAAHFSPAF